MPADDAAPKPSPVPAFLEPVSRAFGRALERHGARAKGVGWKDSQAQAWRFQVLARIFGPETAQGGVSVNDLGCGYGAMFDALKTMPALEGGRYTGYDINAEMLAEARRRIEDARARFVLSHVATEHADYSFVSGTYNVKMHTDDQLWLGYIENNLIELWDKTRTGLAFNMMSTKGPRLEMTLYYADPDYFLKFCRENLSPRARIDEKYGLPEWTIYVLR